MLKFSPANAKTEGLRSVAALERYLGYKRKVYSLDLLSGYSCPFAEQCLSKAKPLPNGKRQIWDGPKTEFRCFSASQEVQYTNVYNARKHNFDLLRGKSSGDMLDELKKALPKNAGIVRIHVAGDFFSQNYFDAWYALAVFYPGILFYAYTKSLPYWVARRTEVKQIPNFILTASRGGRRDNLIGKHKLRQTIVVFSEQEAYHKGLEIDHDDSHAADPSKRRESFALLIHGTQPKGSVASVALSALKGKGSYSRKKAG